MQLPVNDLPSTSHLHPLYHWNIYHIQGLQYYVPFQHQGIRALLGQCKRTCPNLMGFDSIKGNKTWHKK